MYDWLLAHVVPAFFGTVALCLVSAIATLVVGIVKELRKEWKKVNKK